MPRAQRLRNPHQARALPTGKTAIRLPKRTDTNMGYVFDFKDALAYDRWIRKPGNQQVFDFECRLMIDLLKPRRGESLLDIGTGTGMSLKPFFGRELLLSGIDPSPYMLDIAAERLKERVELHRGYAEDLPFDDNTFNLCLFNTTLEFVDDPSKALAEACRVTKNKVFIGILNRYALKGIERRVAGIFNHTIYNRARFFSIWEVKRMLRQQLGDVPLTWRTVCQLPHPLGRIGNSIEQSPFLQRCPFGAFVGMVVTLVPRFRTTPLKLKHSPGAV
jgi:SAM-dependent methyltransferase